MINFQTICRSQRSAHASLQRLNSTAGVLGQDLSQQVLLKFVSCCYYRFCSNCFLDFSLLLLSPLLLLLFWWFDSDPDMKENKSQLMLIEQTIDVRITPFLIDQLCLASNLSFEIERNWNGTPSSLAKLFMSHFHKNLHLWPGKLGWTKFTDFCPDTSPGLFFNNEQYFKKS